MLFSSYKIIVAKIRLEGFAQSVNVKSDQKGLLNLFNIIFVLKGLLDLSMLFSSYKIIVAKIRLEGFAQSVNVKSGQKGLLNLFSYFQFITLFFYLKGLSNLLIISLATRAYKIYSWLLWIKRVCSIGKKLSAAKNVNIKKF